MAALFTGRTRNIGNSTSCIHYKRKNLRWSSDPKPSCVIPVEKKIVVETHASIGKAVEEAPTGVGPRIGSLRRRVFGWIERENHGGRGRRDSLVAVAIRRRGWEEEKGVVAIVNRREPKTRNDAVAAEHNSERKEQSPCHNFLGSGMARAVMNL